MSPREMLNSIELKLKELNFQDRDECFGIRVNKFSVSEHRTPMGFSAYVTVSYWLSETKWISVCGRVSDHGKTNLEGITNFIHTAKDMDKFIADIQKLQVQKKGG